NCFAELTTPAAPSSERIYFIDGASTPPLRGGEYSAAFLSICQFIHPLIERPCSFGGTMLKEFKEFTLKGNVLDLAIGIVIGTAFGKIVTSIVNDLLMPPLGLLIRRVDFKELFVSLSGTSYATLNDAKAAGAPTLNYGLFVNTVIEFLL